MKAADADHQAAAGPPASRVGRAPAAGSPAAAACDASARAAKPAAESPDEARRAARRALRPSADPRCAAGVSAAPSVQSDEVPAPQVRAAAVEEAGAAAVVAAPRPRQRRRRRRLLAARCRGPARARPAPALRLAPVRARARARVLAAAVPAAAVRRLALRPAAPLPGFRTCLRQPQVAGFVLMRRGRMTGATGLGGSGAFDEGFPPGRRAGVVASANNAPGGRVICRLRAWRSTNCLATISSIELDALLTSIPVSCLSRATASGLDIPSSSATL